MKGWAFMSHKNHFIPREGGRDGGQGEECRRDRAFNHRVRNGFPKAITSGDDMVHSGSPKQSWPDRKGEVGDSFLAPHHNGRKLSLLKNSPLPLYSAHTSLNL